MRTRSSALSVALCCAVMMTPAHAQEKFDAIAFGMGTNFQKIIEKCDVAVTTAQRNALAAKVEALRNEIAPRRAQEAIEHFKAMGEDCPSTPKDKEDFNAALTTLIERTPEQFADFMKSGEKAPSPPAPGGAIASDSAIRMVGEWKVNPRQCDIYYEYRDKDDDNAFNAVYLIRQKDRVVIALEYENWRRKKGEQIRAKMSIDDTVINNSTTWISKDGGRAMAAVFDNSIMPSLQKAHSLSLEFNTVVAEFNLPNVGQALQSLASCADK